MKSFGREDVTENSGAYTENIAGFLGELRRQGLLASAGAAADVAALLGTGILASRSAVREGLCAMLAKSRAERRVFLECFDTFFVGKAVLSEREALSEARAEERRRQIEGAREAFPEQTLPDELAEAYMTAAGERQAWLKNMLDYAQSGNRNLPLMQAYLKRVATGWADADAGYGLGAAAEAEDGLLHKELSSITEDEMPQALCLIETLVRRIQLAAERRRRRSGRRGRPDLRRTIHESLRTGGVPVKPAYKKRPRASRRFVVLCDISESMCLFSEFALRFITALGRERGKTRAFIFSEGTEEISLEDFSGFEQAVKSSTLWRRGTDIGSALSYLTELRPPALDRSVTLIILSDAKTIAPARAEAALAAAKEHTKTIIWLNPNKRPSAFAEGLASLVPMLGCGTLEELARACARLS